MGIAVTWILGLEKANYWGNKTFKSVPSIPKNHGSPEKRISNDVWIPPNSVCVCGAVGASEGAGAGLIVQINSSPLTEGPCFVSPSPAGVGAVRTP